MSQWKWGNAELEIDMGDVDFLERYEKAFENMEESEKKLKKDGANVAMIRAYCQMYWSLYDDIFGAGTAAKMFGGKMSTSSCEDSYESFLAECKRQVVEINKKKARKFAKYGVVREA